MYVIKKGDDLKRYFVAYENGFETEIWSSDINKAKLFTDKHQNQLYSSDTGWISTDTEETIVEVKATTVTKIEII